MRKDPPQQPKSSVTLQHIPVLLDATLSYLSPSLGESYLDLTAGYGGHASKVLEITESESTSVLVDRDEYAVSTLEKKFKGVEILHTDFITAAKSLVAQGRTFDVILADLGVSSPQLDISSRGFSFRESGPLDMRMDQRQKRTAADIVNDESVDYLSMVIKEYGEEPKAKAIAQAIVEQRPILDTAQLALVVSSAYRSKWTKAHPATRTFQAIRIALNDELSQVKELMSLLPSLLNKKGRAGIISFHSLEDRIVKDYFKSDLDSGYEAQFEVVTKKAIQGKLEDVNNPRSRSAKLRVAVKK